MGTVRLGRDYSKLYFQITTQYVDKIIPHLGTMHGLSSAVRSSNSIDINLKLFDLLGRLALQGVWTLHLKTVSTPGSQNRNDLEQQLNLISSSIKTLVSNNSILLLPLKDDQAIDISLALFVIGQDIKNHSDIMMDIANFSYIANSNYPCNIYSYIDLLEHPEKNDPQYFTNATAGSIPYPMISLWAALLEDIGLYEKVKLLKEKYLQHSNFQLWYPDETSESNFIRCRHTPAT